MKKRIAWIDTARGIGILFVLLGHILLYEKTNIYIYSFHMPFFFFLSGYLANYEKSITAKEYIAKKIRTLIVPYLFFVTAGNMYSCCLRPKFEHKEVDFSNFWSNEFLLNGECGFNAPVWFLVTLFIIETTMFIVCNGKSRDMNTLLLFSFIAGLLFAPTNFDYTFKLNVAIVAAPFFILGNIVKNKNIIQTICDDRVLLFKSLIVFAAINYIFTIKNDNISFYYNRYSNVVYMYIAAIAGVMFWCLISYKLNNSRLLEYYGENSLVLLSTHYFIYDLFDYLYNKVIIYANFSLNHFWVYIFKFIFTLILVVPLITLFNKLLPKTIGKVSKNENKV